MSYGEIEEFSLNLRSEFLEDVKDSRFGRLKLEALSALPIATGAALSGMGRAVGDPRLAAIPIVCDMMFGSVPMSSPRTIGRYIWGYAKYGIGALLPYADKVYEKAQESIPFIEEAIRNIGG